MSQSMTQTMSVKILKLLGRAPSVLRSLEGTSSLITHDNRHCCGPSHAKISIFETILLQNPFFQKIFKKNAGKRFGMCKTHLKLLKSQFLCFQTYYWRQKCHLSRYGEIRKIPFLGLKIPWLSLLKGNHFGWKVQFVELYQLRGFAYTSRASVCLKAWPKQCL